jgi:hypothetical protein
MELVQAGQERATYSGSIQVEDCPTWGINLELFLVCKDKILMIWLSELWRFSRNLKYPYGLTLPALPQFPPSFIS